MSARVRAVLVLSVLLALLTAGSCDTPKGQECPSRGSIKVKAGTTYHCQPGPGGGLQWQ